MEVWTPGISLPAVAVAQARRAEEAGFDGMLVVDSQNLAGDCYVALALAAKETERLRLGTGVTNPFTRHAAVTASAIASIQAASGGRAVLGIGRGDSALAHLGLAPAPPGLFADYLTRLQGYLRGDDVPFTDEGIAGVGTLGLAGGPATSRLHWLGADPKVPVDVAASGPLVIGIAAVLADRVTFAVGADPDRLAWALDVARQARVAAGLDPVAVSYGAYVNVVVHDDPDTALALASGGMSTFARFNVMHGTTHGPVGDESRELLTRLHDSYDMRAHTRAGSPQAEQLTGDFAERFAILGPPERCIDRLQELRALGLDHVVVVGASLGADPTEARAAGARFVAEVLPALH